LRALVALPPTLALLALLALGFVLPGLFAHDPWKSFDAIGVEIIHQMQVSGDWLVPRIAGEPWLEDPPLFHWAALVLARLFAFALPFHDAVRAASGIAVLAACGLLYSAARVQREEEESRTEAGAAVLLLIGTIGLMVHAHEAITDLAALAACSGALAALVRAGERPLAMGAAFGIALGIAFLSTGFRRICRSRRMQAPTPTRWPSTCSRWRSRLRSACRRTTPRWRAASSTRRR
jgi:4-amino-4-deoxy-L-arabinose transferase-like glycosyltransferase